MYISQQLINANHTLYTHTQLLQSRECSHHNGKLSYHLFVCLSILTEPEIKIRTQKIKVFENVVLIHLSCYSKKKRNKSLCQIIIRLIARH